MLKNTQAGPSFPCSRIIEVGVACHDKLQCVYFVTFCEFCSSWSVMFTTCIAAPLVLINGVIDIPTNELNVLQYHSCEAFPSMHHAYSSKTV